LSMRVTALVFPIAQGRLLPSLSGPERAADRGKITLSHLISLLLLFLPSLRCGTAMQDTDRGPSHSWTCPLVESVFNFSVRRASSPGALAKAKDFFFCLTFGAESRIRIPTLHYASKRGFYFTMARQREMAAADGESMLRAD